MRRLTLLAALLTAFAQAQEHSNAKEISLAEALQQSFQFNPRVQSAQAELLAANRAASKAKAQKLPELVGNVFATDGTQQSILSGSPGVDPRALMMVPQDQALIGNLMLMLPLYTGGRLEGWIARASAQERLAAGQLQEVLGDVALMVSEAYFQVGEAAEMIVAEEARVAALEVALKNERAQFEAGRGIEASVLRAEAELGEAQRALITARNERDKALLDLKEAMGVSLGSDLIANPERSLPTVQTSLEELLAMARARRGLVLAAKARSESASADTKIAEGALKPQVYGTAMADSMRLGGASESGYTFGLTLSLPLFDGGMRRSEVNQMRALHTSAQAMLREAELMVEKQVRQALLDLQTSLTNAQSAASSLKSAESAHDVIALRVESGKGILLERLDALETLTRARAELATATFAYRIATARLERAAGLAPGALIPGETKP